MMRTMARGASARRRAVVAGRHLVAAPVVVALVLAAAGPVLAQDALAGCSQTVRQRLAQAGYEAAQSEIAAAATVHQKPLPTMQTCVADMIRRLSTMKTLSGDFAGIVDQLIGQVERQACNVIEGQLAGVMGQGFDPAAFLNQRLPAGTPPLVRSTTVPIVGGGTQGGNGGVGVAPTVPYSATPRPAAPRAAPSDKGGGGLGSAVNRLLGM